MLVAVTTGQWKKNSEPPHGPPSHFECFAFHHRVLGHNLVIHQHLHFIVH